MSCGLHAWSFFVQWLPLFFSLLFFVPFRYAASRPICLLRVVILVFSRLFYGYKISSLFFLAQLFRMLLPLILVAATAAAYTAVCMSIKLEWSFKCWERIWVFRTLTALASFFVLPCLGMIGRFVGSIPSYSIRALLNSIHTCFSIPHSKHAQDPFLG